MPQNKSSVTPEHRIQKGQFVIPSVGPHKGEPHKVIHIHDDGKMSIMPWNRHPSKVKYRMGAAMATHDQVELMKEDMQTEGFKNWTFELEPGQTTKVVHGDHKGLRGTVVTKHNNGESYTIKDSSGKTSQHHISTLSESNNTPYVKPFSHAGSSEQAGWKAMNKHGKTKFFGKDFKASACKHAGINEEQIDELSRQTLGRYVKQAVGDKERIDKDAKDMSFVGHEAKKDGDHEQANKFFHKAGGLAWKASNRHHGINKAVNKMMKEGEMNTIEEGKRGRPSKNAEDNAEHVVMQMRKNVSMNGSKPIKFADGSEHAISSGHAGKVLDHYNSYTRPADKEAFQKHIGASHRNFTDWIGGKKFTPSDATKSPTTRGVNNDEIFGHDKPRESSTLRTVKSLRHIKQTAAKKDAREKFRRRLADIIASA